MIPRLLTNHMHEDVAAGRVWMLFGARRVGKTSLVQEYLRTRSERWFTGQGEDATVAELMQSCSTARLRQAFGSFDGVFLDEAHTVPKIGTALKLLVDSLPALKVIVTGSSAFHLEQRLGQPLTGRRRVAYLHPITCAEIRAWKDPLAAAGLVEDLLLYGSYPEILQIGNPAERRSYLRQLVEDYLFQDILAFEQLRNARKLRELVTLIAHQVGAEVSLNELANTLQLNKATVERYLDLLVKNFILHRSGGFSRNLRKEVTKSARYYFVDTGIRNAVIDQFQPLRLRPDTGALWENFVINERRRQNDYGRLERQGYFWRTYDQQEIDWVEQDVAGRLEGFECKWQEQRYKAPAGWRRSYPDAVTHLVHRSNFGEFF